MARKSLKPQLNQIRAWVQEGRTDAWIAHQLEISASELREFRRQHDLAPAGEGEAVGMDVDLRDEIEAEIEATAGGADDALPGFVKADLETLSTELQTALADVKVLENQFGPVLETIDEKAGALRRSSTACTPR